MEARIAIRQKEKSYSAHLSWQHSPDSDEILVTGPLGQGIAELRRDAAGAHLIAADRREAAARDWDQLSQDVFGTVLPLDGMASWLTGAVPGGKTDALGRLQDAEAQGWHIVYAAYESDAADALPSRVSLQREDIEVRLAIEQWQLR